MRYSAASLLLLACIFARAPLAQENVQSPKVPQGNSVSICSDIPKVDTNSNDYNNGYREGYKVGCNLAASASKQTASRHQTSAGQLDEYTADTIAPVSYKKENEDLLNALQSVCRPAADIAVKKGAGKNEVWNLRYRVNLLTSLVQGVVKCQ